MSSDRSVTVRKTIISPQNMEKMIKMKKHFITKNDSAPKDTTEDDEDNWSDITSVVSD